MSNLIKVILIALLVIGGSLTLDAKKKVPNLIYISIDGLSRETFYGLLNKKKLPNIEKIIDRGNYRNMSILDRDADTIPSYFELLTGYSAAKIIVNRAPKGWTFFERIKKYKPEIQVGAIVSLPQNLDKDDLQILPILERALDSLDYRVEEIKRTASAVAREVLTFFGSKHCTLCIIC